MPPATHPSVADQATSIHRSLGNDALDTTGEADMNAPRILVVDDHEPLLTAIQGILEGEGYAVFTAINGVQALEMMDEVAPNLIIADIMMPRMDGYAL
jgi:PleD family two-component response regulator